MNQNWSILNSTVKTYPSKKNRTSQSYRLSSYAPHHPFLDDDGELDLFDQLVSDEKVKGPNQSSLAGSVDQTMQSLVQKRHTLLRNVDNVLPEDRHCVRKKPKTKKRDKENVKHRSGLFVDDDEEDPYLFDFSGEKKVRCKSSKVRSSLREQKIKSTKLKKAQELRERQQLERARWRMSKVCSTPMKDTSISNDPRPDVSYISKDSSPERNAPSNITSVRYDNMEKSSDIFISETSKPNIRVKLSFDGTFRDECKPLSSHLAEFSCCDQDDHKNSGNSGARSVESAASDYVTCLKVGSDDEHDENSCCSQGLNTITVKNLGDSYPSQHRVPCYQASPSHPEKTCANENATTDCTDPECENENILFAEDVNDDEIVSILSAEVSESEMKIIDSEDSGNEIHDLTSDVDNLRLSDAPKITSDPDRDAAHSPNESHTSNHSVKSGYSFSLSLSDWSDEDRSVENIDESKNLTDRLRRKADCVEQTDEPASTSSSSSESPMRASRESDAANESKLNCSFTSTRSIVIPCSANGTVSRRRATRLFHSRPSSELPRLQDSNIDNSASTWSMSGSPSMEVTPTIVEVMSETEPIFQEKSAETKEIICADPQRRTRVLYSVEEVEDKLKSPDFSDRVTRISESSQDLSDVTTSNEDTVMENITRRAKAKTDGRTYSERKLQLCALTPIERRIQPTLIYEELVEEGKESNNVIFESTRLSNGIISENEAITNSLDDTFPVDSTVVENIAPANEQKTPGTVGNPVTLKLDDVSPIEKVEPSSIVSTVKRRHRVAAGRRPRQHVGFFDTLAEEKENCASEEDGETFEDTRTNASQIFRRPTDSYLQFPASSSYATAGQLSQSRFNNSSMSAIHLEKGKKWRRSFIAFKNIMNHRMSVIANEDCGRLCHQKIENLINLQNDATIIRRELEECSTPKTGSDETVVAGFEEGDTIAARFGRQEKARFSLCINAPNALCDISGRPPQIEDVDEKSCRRARKTRASQIEAGDFANISRWNSTLLERCCVSTNVAREIVLKYCGQTEPVPFDACFSDRVLKNCLKIGEGVYGEVFLLTRGCKKSVIKIIPIEGDQLVNGERQKTFEEIFSELAITSHLSDLNEKGSFYTECFARLVNRHCVYGKYPRRLITLWKEYDLSKGSENDSPSIFEEDQLYIILELDHGGEDIESFSFNNAQQTLSVFNQVAHALAVAEQAFQFEHRDLHWGNILVTRCSRKKTKFVIQNRESFVNLNGVKVTIIDYTLSRITIKKHTLFNDLGKDPDLFIAEGDFQFEVYRMMRNAVKDVWNTYAPVTNVYWLRYLLDKMVKEIKYIRSNSALHRTSLAELKQMYERISRDDHCVSAFQIANSECSYG